MEAPHPDKKFEEDNFSPEKKNRLEQFMDQVNDNVTRESTQGFPSGNDEASALNYHEDDYHPTELSRVHPDEELEKVVRDLLRSSKHLDAQDITVSVDNSNVKLSGTVHSQFERDYAQSVARLVHGVGNVISEIIVKINPGILPTDIGRNPG
jgi:hypothetical protein